LTDEIGKEHWTTKGDVKLFLWEKYVGSPEGKPAALFVHGSSMASQPTFDLTVPGRPDSSVMDWFARRGFACWCVDMEGYGRSDKTRDIFCDIANGADGWLVAYAKVMDCVIVTQEVLNPDIKRKVPIPNVCQSFSVSFIDTFEMLRRLGVRFS
jgi:pimeloyl-ACP methyl ester carboxylesterase